MSHQIVGRRSKVRQDVSWNIKKKIETADLPILLSTTTPPPKKKRSTYKIYHGFNMGIKSLLKIISWFQVTWIEKINSDS